MYRLLVLMRGVLSEFLFPTISGAHIAAAYHMSRGASSVYVTQDY